MAFLQYRQGTDHCLTHISIILTDGIGELAAKVFILFISCGHKVLTVQTDFASFMSMLMAEVLYKEIYEYFRTLSPKYH